MLLITLLIFFLSTPAKCPRTVPPKSSKTRISRLALLASRKSGDNKIKTKPFLKSSRTPSNAEAKTSSAAAKALTTPRNKKRISNLGSFRSVRNPKMTTVMAPKNRTVAKALVFHSPKKTANPKSSSQLDGTISSLCSGMKKLEINSAKKILKESDKQLDASRKLKAREVKSRFFDSLCSKNQKGQEMKAFSSLKKKKTKDVQVVCEAVENESSDMEIDEKSRNGSLELSSMLGASKSDGQVDHRDTLTALLTKDATAELSDTTRSYGNSLSQETGPNSQAQCREDEENSKGNNCEEKEAKSYLKTGKTPTKTSSNDKENDAVCEKETINQPSGDDDKENDSLGDDNRSGSFVLSVIHMHYFPFFFLYFLC